MNKYDEGGRLIEPRPRQEEVDEERFAAWVSVVYMGLAGMEC